MKRARRSERGARSACGMLGLLVLCTGCASASTRARHPRSMPKDEAARRAVQLMGRRMHRALAQGEPQRLLFDDLELRALLTPEAASRAGLLRATIDARLDIEPARFRVFQRAPYQGLCIQNARMEPARGAVGLREAGWTFSRALVVGSLGRGEWVASWMEGTFVYTDAGFGAVRLDRVEAPRLQHADLRLADCDLAVGIEAIQDMGLSSE